MIFTLTTRCESTFPYHGDHCIGASYYPCLVLLCSMNVICYLLIIVAKATYLLQVAFCHSAHMLMYTSCDFDNTSHDYIIETSTLLMLVSYFTCTQSCCSTPPLSHMHTKLSCFIELACLHCIVP